MQLLTLISITLQSADVIVHFVVDEMINQDIHFNTNIYI